MVFGINTNQTKFAKEIEEIASSFQKEFRIEVDTQKVITEFCNLLEDKIRKRIGENEK